MSRQTYMPEKQIQELEQMDEAHVSSMIMTIGVQKAAELMVTMMRALRIKSMVANAAWRVVKEAENGTITPESFLALQKALSLYSPGNFQPEAMILEHICHTLEELYDYLAEWNKDGATTMILMEQLFERIEQARARLPQVL